MNDFAMQNDTPSWHTNVRDLQGARLGDWKALPEVAPRFARLIGAGAGSRGVRMLLK